MLVFGIIYAFSNNFAVVPRIALVVCKVHNHNDYYYKNSSQKFLTFSGTSLAISSGIVSLVTIFSVLKPYRQTPNGPIVTLLSAIKSIYSKFTFTVFNCR